MGKYLWIIYIFQMDPIYWLIKLNLIADVLDQAVWKVLAVY